MEPLRKYLLDANIYGELAVDSEVDKVVREYELCKGFVLIYGVNEIVRKELRATPKGEKAGVRKLRISLLALYDALAGKHELLVTDEHRALSDEYYKAYAGFGGSEPKRVMSNDFLLVACASAKGMDVVVSDDERTLLTENAVKAYRLVNDLRKLRTPHFMDYDEFKLELRNCALRSGAPDEFVGGSDKFRILLVFLNFLSQRVQLRFPYRYLFSFHDAFIRISAYLNVLFDRGLMKKSGLPLAFACLTCFPILLTKLRRKENRRQTGKEEGGRGRFSSNPFDRQLSEFEVKGVFSASP